MNDTASHGVLQRARERVIRREAVVEREHAACAACAASRGAPSRRSRSNSRLRPRKRGRGAVELWENKHFIPSISRVRVAAFLHLFVLALCVRFHVLTLRVHVRTRIPRAMCVQPRLQLPIRALAHSVVRAARARRSMRLPRRAAGLRLGLAAAARRHHRRLSSAHSHSVVMLCGRSVSQSIAASHERVSAQGSRRVSGRTCGCWRRSGGLRRCGCLRPGRGRIVDGYC
jgi:hypothetical protein